MSSRYFFGTFFFKQIYEGVVAEMLKVADETGTLWMTDAFNALVKNGKIPED